MTFEGESLSNLTGKLLISESAHDDLNFQYAVILVISHDSKGAFGIVINKQSDATLGDIFPEQFGQHKASCIPIFVGGPVQQEYLFLLQQGAAEESDLDRPLITEAVYFVPNVRPVLEDIYSSGEEPESGLRFFSGYSGWGPGQLEMEIEQEFWITHPASVDIIFHPDPDEAWRDVLRKKGGVYWVMAETGSRPSMN